LLSAPANASKSITASFQNVFTLCAMWADEFNRGTTVGGTFDMDISGSGNTGTIINTPVVTVSGVDITYFAACVAQNITSINTPWTASGVSHFGNWAGYSLNRTISTSASASVSPSSLWNSTGLSIK
jgi:hypothetical protein